MNAPPVTLWIRESSSSVRYLCVYAKPLHEALGLEARKFHPAEHWTWDRARRFLLGLNTPAALALVETLDRQAAILRPKKPPKPPVPALPPLAPWSPLDVMVRDAPPPILPTFRKGEPFISARDVWAFFKPVYHFTDWIVYRNRQHLKTIEPGETAGLLARPYTRKSTGGRPAKDYLLTIRQALALVKLEGEASAGSLPAWLGGFALLHEAGREGSPDIGPAAALLAECVTVKEAYSVRELERLLSGRPGFPKTERGWRERIGGKRWPQVEGADKRTVFYVVDYETVSAVKIVVAETLIRDGLAGWQLP